MIKFDGERLFALPRDVVATRLADASFLVACLKNVERVIEATPDRANLKIRTGFSFLSTSLDLVLTVTGRSTDRATFDALSKGVGATSLVRAALNFVPFEQQTKVQYVAEIVERTGFLKIVSAGLIQSAAKTVIDDTWKAIEAKMLLDAGQATS